MSTPGLGVVAGVVAGSAAMHPPSDYSGIFGGADARNQRAVRDVHERMKRIPWTPAVLISLHPYPQYASGPMQHDLKLPGAPAFEDESVPRLVAENGRHLTFTQYVYPHYLIETRPTEAGDHTAHEILPIELAIDFIAQHSGQNETGGLFCYEIKDVTIPPLESKDARAYIPNQTVRNVADLPFMTVREALEIAHARQVTYYLSRYEAAQNAWNDADRRSRKNISANDRKMTKLLRSWGVLQSDPEWLVHTNPHSGPRVSCPICGHEPKKGALRCTNGTCSHIFEPFNAYKDGHIDLETPGAELALRRLSKEQLVELNLYPHVLPLDEHRKKLLKDRAKEEKSK